METINVSIKQKNINYDIFFGNDIFSIIKSKIVDINTKKIIFIIDDNVFELYNKQILFGLKNLNADYLLIEHGEQNKNYKTVFKIVDKFIDAKITRKDYIVALGGGVTGDMTGFACSIFKRGINFIQVPTTLLSMFDSSVGGKTGFDYNGIKNLIGSFYSPEFVIINNSFLFTLPNQEILSGFFEGVKHSILNGKIDFINFINSYELFYNGNNDLDKIIMKNINYKLSIVQSDPLEDNGIRKILNYGHTFGHALETFSDFKLGHGICVGFGIIFANILSSKKGFLDKNISEEINEKIKNLLKNIKLEKIDFEIIYEFMLNDKKNTSDSIKFILLKEFGTAIENEIKKDDLKICFQEFMKFID